MSQPSTAKEQGGVLSGVMPTTYNANDPITLFIIQVIMIVFFTRILHLVLSRFRQPRVISEIIGGIILGPSVLGHIPGYMDTIFPVVSRPNLNLLSTLGLILFLFIVGVELNPTVLIKNARVALTISAAGIALPFALGIGVGYGLYHAMGNDYVSFSSFILFIGVAMSITAFPVLARILSELQLLRTPVGSTALAAGVGDDVAAWVLLALVVTIINASNSLVALYVFLLAIAWVLIVIFAIRPILLKLIVKTGSNDNGPTVTMMVITLSLVLISSFVTNIIGVHAIFGGFIIGVIIPHEGGFAVGITEKIEDLVNVLFLPIYFALSGIKTQIGLLNDGASWGWVILVIVVAMTGKITGATLAARFNKLAWRESLTIGVFMSCKGLVELIVLNIGLDAKVINDKVFVIMVAMALVTTIVTTPLATWLYPHEYQRKMELKRIGHSGPGDGSQVSDETISTKKNRLLIVLNKVEYLPPMMMLVQLLQPLSAFVKQQGEKDTSVLSKSSDSITVHVLRLVELTQRISTVMKINENEETLHDPIMNIFRTFGQLNFVKVKANLAVVAQQDFAQHVAERAEDTDANFVIIPWGGAGAIIDDPSNPFVGPKEKKETSPQVAHFTQEVFSEVSIRANVGVFVDRGLGVSSLTTSIENGISNISVRVFLPFFGGIDDREALSFVIQLLDHPNVSVNVLRIKKSSEPTENDAILKKNTFSTETEENNTQDNSEEPQRPSLIHKISSASAHILNSNDEREASDNADEELLTQTLKSRTGVVASNARINYTEILSSTPLQTAVNRAKEVVGRKDLIVVGRGRHEATFNHRTEFLDILKNLGDYGIDTHKILGDAAQAFLSGGVAASILVLQAKRTPNSPKLKEIA
ncbi:Sodium/hydrogen exchanger family-domain-containing protein [Glomus cerebriforme]|uniref:Sodium/hydrogen exchanger family-domain-containing protein n=1 Tax=Glomus cerebriforme TaxID=658196 RepID=A0A397SJB7_9GLOM|nr:Sodium/hydrogen exchanger family-domain-containing protein [Glomus cerebriforme]